MNNRHVIGSRHTGKTIYRKKRAEGSPGNPENPPQCGGVITEGERSLP